MRISRSLRVRWVPTNNAGEARERMTWEITVRPPDAEPVTLERRHSRIHESPTPQQQEWANARREFTVPESEWGDYPGPGTNAEIIKEARKLIPPKISSVGTDLPPLGHRTLGDAHFTHDVTLDDHYLHYQNLTIGVPPQEGVAPTLVRVTVPPGGALLAVQDQLVIHPGGVLLGDGRGAPGGQAGGWPDQPAEDWPSYGKMQELHALLDRTGFHYTDHGRRAQPVGGGGGGHATEPGREGFSYCGAGGWGHGLTAGGDGTPAAGGAFIAIACREIRNAGLISSRGLSVAAGDNGGCGGGGGVSLLYEEGTPGRVDVRGGRLPGNPGTHRDGIDGDAVLIKLPESRHLME